MYKQFELAGHHQPLELRATLKRNIESTRPLHHAFIWESLVQIVVASVFFYADYVARGTSVRETDVKTGIVIVSLTKICINLALGGLPIILILQYPMLQERLGGYVLCCNRNSAVVYPFHTMSLDQQTQIQTVNITHTPTDPYMLELRELWNPTTGK